jgi:CheY-like chemotaxis protein
LFSEAFFTTKPRRRGLGLLVVYGIAAASRGGLRLENDPAGGAVAEVVLPVSDTEPLETTAIQEKTTERPAVSPGGEKVLVVDDDPLVRQFVQATLQRAGYRVEAVGTTDEAVVSYHADPQDPFRLVLSDLVMPRGTGLDLARRLLQTDVNARLLFMSGRESLEARPKTPALDSFELIQKPFRSERLLLAVRAAIDRTNSMERGA